VLGKAVLAKMPVMLSAGATRVPGSPVPAATTQATVAAAQRSTVAPLQRSVQPDLLIVGASSLSGKLLTDVSKLPGIVADERIEAVRMSVNGTQTAVVGVNPSKFRSFAAAPTGKANALWQGVADGGIALSYEMGQQDKVKLGGTVTVTGATTRKLSVPAFGTLGIGGVNAVVSDATAEALGAPAGNAIVISVSTSDFTADSAALSKLLPKGTSLEPLVSLVESGSGTSVDAGVTAGAGSITSSAVPATALTAMLQAGLSRRGLPYVWGGDGPTTFDCSGLVQWSFAQAGIVMPRVAADQAEAGPAVPVSQLQPGDLLFYHTDPTAPSYISHVAIYLGNGQMLQAPETGENVEVVPAAFGSEFAGAIRVSPAQAAKVAGALA
jgi:cell wall-associated NlpC family hydrolase